MSIEDSLLHRCILGEEDDFNQIPLPEKYAELEKIGLGKTWGFQKMTSPQGTIFKLKVNNVN